MAEAVVAAVIPATGANLAVPSFLLDDGRVTIFSYGSNSTAQLRARVKNPALVSTDSAIDSALVCHITH